MAGSGGLTDFASSPGRADRLGAQLGGQALHEAGELGAQLGWPAWSQAGRHSGLHAVTVFGAKLGGPTGAGWRPHGYPLTHLPTTVVALSHLRANCGARVSHYALMMAVGNMAASALG